MTSKFAIIPAAAVIEAPVEAQKPPPPRILQYFVHELVQAELVPEKLRQLRLFTRAVDEAFDGSCRVEPQDVQLLLEAVFDVLHIDVPEAHTVAPPRAIAGSLRAVAPGIAVAPAEAERDALPTATSADWTEPHVPLYAAAVRLLSRLFDNAAPQAAPCYRALTVLAVRGLAAVEPPNPIDEAVAPLLAPSPKRGHEAGADSRNTSRVAALNVTLPQGQRSLLAFTPSSRSLAGLPTSATTVDADGAMQHVSLVATGTAQLCAARLRMDHLLRDASLRPAVLELWRQWDLGGIDVRAFTSNPAALHVYMPTRRLTSSTAVYRDFVVCPARPKLTRPWGDVCAVHLKTNIRARSDVMYRLVVEGYNYGVNAAIYSDVVGVTNRQWEQIGDMAAYGWPEGWDAEMCRDYAAGATASQYYSTDGFLVIRLRAKSFFCVGFTASAWMIFHGYGAGYPITGEVFHQDDDL
jgi:hypothetical protein